MRKPKFGDKAICKMCDKEIEYVGAYWRHAGGPWPEGLQPNHPALPPMPNLEELLSETIKVCQTLMLAEKTDGGLDHLYLTAALWNVLEVVRKAGFPPEEMSEGSFSLPIPSGFDQIEALAEAKIAASNAIGVIGELIAGGGDIYELEELHFIAVIRHVCWCMRAEGMNIRSHLDAFNKHMEGRG